jgi:micrococcal nuclease
MRPAVVALLLAWLATGPTAALPLCGGSPRLNCIVDGDTLWLAGEKIRLQGIDTAEIHNPKCPDLNPLPIAYQARDRLAQIVRGQITVERSGELSFDRTVATVLADGRDVGATLLAEGLARRYVANAPPWCD